MTKKLAYCIILAGQLLANKSQAGNTLETGQATTWQGPINGGWNQPTNWSSGTIPTGDIGAIIPANSRVVINNLETAAWVCVGNNAEISGPGTVITPTIISTNSTLDCVIAPATGLQIEGTCTVGTQGWLNVTNGGFTSTQKLTIDGKLTWKGQATARTSTIKGQIINKGTISWSNGTIQTPDGISGTTNSIWNIQHGMLIGTNWSCAGIFNLTNATIEIQGSMDVAGRSELNCETATNKIMVGASETVSWQGTLTVNHWTNDPNSRITFGYRGNDLTTNQLDKITFCDANNIQRGAELSPFGWLEPQTLINITHAPQNTAIDLGGTATLTVVAVANTQVTYQWLFNGMPITNATNSTYTISDAQPANQGTYSVRIATGTVQSTTTGATVTINQTPIITGQPKTEAVHFGETIQLTASAEGTPPLKYQWIHNGTPIAGATQPTFTKTNASSLDAGSYILDVSNPAGQTHSMAAAVRLKVTITEEPTNQTLVAGQPTTLHLQAIAPSGPVDVTWYNNQNGWNMGAGTTTEQDNGSTTTVNSSYTFTPATNTTVACYHAWVHDASDGENTEQACTQYNPRQPGYPPVISVQPGMGTVFTNAASVNITATAMANDNGATISSIDIYQNGTELSQNGTYTWKTTGNQTNTFLILATDTRGLQSWTNVTYKNVEIATNTPTVRITNPEAAKVGQPIQIRIEATNNWPGSIAGLTVWINGIVKTQTDNTTTSINWTPTANTTNTIVAAARLQNPSLPVGWATNTVTAYTPTPPKITLEPGSETITNQHSITLTAKAQAEDPFTKIRSVTFFEGTNNLGTNNPITITNLSGKNELRAKAITTDNETNSATNIITVNLIPPGDLTPPIVLVNAPRKTTGTNPIPITVEAETMGTGTIKATWVTINGITIATNCNDSKCWTINWQPPGHGTTTIQAKAETEENVVGTSEAIVETNVAADTPPELNFEETIPTGPFDLAVTGYDPVDGNIPAVWDLDGQVENNTSTVITTPGLHSIAATTTNRRGQTTKATLIINAYTPTAPKVRINPGSESITNVGAITLTAEATGQNPNSHIETINWWEGTNYAGTGNKLTITNCTGTQNITCAASDNYGMTGETNAIIQFITVNTNTIRGAAGILVEEAPNLNGGTINGSLEQNKPVNITCQSGTTINQHLLLPGEPTIRTNGTANIGQITKNTGSSTGAFTLTINSGTTIGSIVEDTPAAPWPAVPPTARPTGTQNETVNSTGITITNWNTIKNITLNSGTGNQTVPGGNYGNFTANSGSSFTLGKPGQTTAYAFERLNINYGASLKINGPVIINIENSVATSGTWGNPNHPKWLTVEEPTGNLTINYGISVYGHIITPNGTLNINGTLNGAAICERLTLNYGATINEDGTTSSQIETQMRNPTTGTNENPATEQSSVQPYNLILNFNHDILGNDEITRFQPDYAAPNTTLATNNTWPGSALDLTHTNSYIVCGQTSVPNWYASPTNFTWGLWFNASQLKTGTSYYLLDTRDPNDLRGIAIWLTGTGNGTAVLNWGFDTSEGKERAKAEQQNPEPQHHSQGSEPIQTGKWHHVRLVRLGNTGYCLLDGKEQTGMELEFTGTSFPANPITIGNAWPHNAQFRGYLDSIQNKPTGTAQEITNYTPNTVAGIGNSTRNTSYITLFYPSTNPTWNNCGIAQVTTCHGYAGCWVLHQNTATALSGNIQGTGGTLQNTEGWEGQFTIANNTLLGNIKEPTGYADWEGERESRSETATIKTLACTINGNTATGSLTIQQDGMAKIQLNGDSPAPIDEIWPISITGRVPIYQSTENGGIIGWIQSTETGAAGSALQLN